MGSSISRRTVAKGALWSVPTIIVAAPAPVMAASACSPNAAAVPTRTYSIGEAKTRIVPYLGVFTTCTTSVPAGVTFVVKWCNNAATAVSLTNTATHANMTLNSGETGTVTIPAGSCKSWSYTTTAQLPPSSGLSFNMSIQRVTGQVVDITSTVTVTGMPPGLKNSDPAGGISVVRMSYPAP